MTISQGSTQSYALAVLLGLTVLLSGACTDKDSSSTQRRTGGQGGNPAAEGDAAILDVSVTQFTRNADGTLEVEVVFPEDRVFPVVVETGTAVPGISPAFQALLNRFFVEIFVGNVEADLIDVTPNEDIRRAIYTFVLKGLPEDVEILEILVTLVEQESGQTVDARTFLFGSVAEDGAEGGGEDEILAYPFTTPARFATGFAASGLQPGDESFVDLGTRSGSDLQDFSQEFEDFGLGRLVAIPGTIIDSGDNQHVDAVLCLVNTTFTIIPRADYNLDLGIDPLHQHGVTSATLHVRNEPGGEGPQQPATVTALTLGGEVLTASLAGSGETTLTVTADPGDVIKTISVTGERIKVEINGSTFGLAITDLTVTTP